MTTAINRYLVLQRILKEKRREKKMKRTLFSGWWQASVTIRNSKQEWWSSRKSFLFRASTACLMMCKSRKLSMRSKELSIRSRKLLMSSWNCSISRIWDLRGSRSLWRTNNKSLKSRIKTTGSSNLLIRMPSRGP